MSTTIPKKQKFCYSMFKHEDDRKQCIQIYNTINKDGQIKKLGVSDNIISIISQLAVGVLLHCTDKNCDEFISFLQQELQDITPESHIPVQCCNPDCSKLLYARACNISPNSKDAHWCTTESDVGDYCDGCLTSCCVYQHLTDCGKCNECDNIVMICPECFDPHTKIWICSNHIE